MTYLLIIAGLLTLLLLLLAIPIHLAFQLRRIDRLQGQITLRWLFGLMRFRIPIPEPKGSRKKPAEERQKTNLRRKSKRRGSGLNFIAVMKQTAFRRRVYRFVTDVLRAADLHDLQLLARLGLEDPADTGRLWALIGPLSAAAQNVRCARLRIEPEFMEPVFEFQAAGRVRLIPLEFLGLLVAFALSPPSIRAWRTLISNHA